MIRDQRTAECGDLEQSTVFSVQQLPERCIRRGHVEVPELLPSVYRTGREFPDQDCLQSSSRATLLPPHPWHCPLLPASRQWDGSGHFQLVVQVSISYFYNSGHPQPEWHFLSGCTRSSTHTATTPWWPCSSPRWRGWWAAYAGTAR